MERTRILLATALRQRLESFLSYCEANATDFEVVPVLLANECDTMELLMHLESECPPDVLIHWTSQSEPPIPSYEWVTDINPFLKVLHVSDDGHFCLVERKLVVSGVTANSLSDLLETIRIGCDDPVPTVSASSA